MTVLGLCPVHMGEIYIIMLIEIQGRRPIMNQEKIGKFIAECRKQKNLTQEQLSEILGVSSKSVSRWENGKTLPDYTILDSLFNALDISINEFYYGEKMIEQDFKHLSERNLRLYFMERYGKRLKFKFAVLSGIVGMLIFIIVQLVFLR